MLDLAYTDNKQAIRRLWDKTIIRQFSDALGRPLSYFGLPGPDIQDIVDWAEFLGWKTGVEDLDKSGPKRDEQRRRINQLQANIMLLGFDSTWDLQRGKLEDIILDGVDVGGDKPHRLAVGKNKKPRMFYDLHNWDFQNGLAYRNSQRDSKRIKAISRCLELQRGHPFLLFLTLNVRHTLGEEPSKYLTDLARELDSPERRLVLNWYSEQLAKKNRDHFRTKAIVPLIVRQAAHIHAFNCHCYPPVYYQGPKEHLLHFTFSLLPSGTMLPCFSTQTIAEVIDLPLMSVENGNFKFAVEQHPGFNENDALALLKAYELPPACNS